MFRARSVRGSVMLVAALALAACAGEEVDDTTGSRLEQPPANTPPQPPIEAGDIAIAAQQFSHDIRNLPQIADDATPPLVRFTGVTSIVKTDDHQPADFDTAPYTTLLRDRLLLGDREKLRFVERQLPPLVVATRGKHAKVAPIDVEQPEYEVLAELRGRTASNTLRIQMEFVQISGGQILLNELYRIRRESPDVGQAPDLPEDANQGQVPLPATPEGAGSGGPGGRSPVQDDTPAMPAGGYNPPAPPNQ